MSPPAGQVFPLWGDRDGGTPLPHQAKNDQISPSKVSLSPIRAPSPTKFFSLPIFSLVSPIVNWNGTLKWKKSLKSLITKWVNSQESLFLPVARVFTRIDNSWLWKRNADGKLLVTPTRIYLLNMCFQFQSKAARLNCLKRCSLMQCPYWRPAQKIPFSRLQKFMRRLLCWLRL